MENEIIIYQPDETIRLDVRLENETVWLSQLQMSELFQRKQPIIAKHIKNVFKEGEVTEENNTVYLQIPNSDKPVKFYDLDIIISVGYRVKSIRGTLFRKWATKILKDHLLRGYTLNNNFYQMEEKIDRRLSKQDEKIEALEGKVDFFVKTSIPPRQGVFYDGEVFDADVFVTKYIIAAQKSIVLIDNYVNMTTLEMLAKKEKSVQLKIITSKKGNNLAKSDIQRFQEQYGNLEIVENEAFHDRFIIIDEKELYVSGASLKDLGKKCFAFNKLDSKEIPKLKERIK